MKKILSLILAAVVAVGCLTGCGRYTSSYSALLLISSNDSHAASLRFSEFKGTKVFKLRTGAGAAATLAYTGTLSGGSATVYYDCDGTKTELFRISGGEEVDSSAAVPGGATVYIIFTSDGACKSGAFTFEVQ